MHAQLSAGYPEAHTWLFGAAMDMVAGQDDGGMHGGMGEAGLLPGPGLCGVRLLLAQVWCGGQVGRQTMIAVLDALSTGAQQEGGGSGGHACPQVHGGGGEKVCGGVGLGGVMPYST